MRPILFRGVSLKDGRWVTGSYVERTMGNGKVKHDIIGPHGSTYVDPDTIGQFTGACDMDTDEIFEGDILAKDGILFDQERDVDYILVVWSQGGFYFKENSGAEYPMSYYNTWRMEIVGNIHNNPELAKLFQS